MGEVQVPRDALWRAQTQRAVENFPISGTPIEPALIHAIGEVKAAAARANGELGVLDADPRRAIEAAAEEVAAGDHDDAFPIDVFQTGSGTSSNMNANEVIASLAARPASRCTPTTTSTPRSPPTTPSRPRSTSPRTGGHRRAAARDRRTGRLAGGQGDRVRRPGEVRPHPPDGRDAGHARPGVRRVRRDGALRRRAARGVLPRVRELPLGGTAVGTGINTPAGFAARVIEALVESTGQPFTEARNHFEAQGTRDSLVELSGVLKTYRGRPDQDLQRPALDVVRPDHRPGRDPPPRPPAGLEHHARQGQPGAARGHADGLRPGDRQRRRGHRAGASGSLRAQRRDAGDRPQRPGVGPAARRLLPVLAERCVDGITADADRMRRYAESSPSIVTPLNKYIGYEAAAKIAKQALADGATIRETVIKLGYVERGELTEATARRGARRRVDDPPVTNSADEGPGAVRRRGRTSRPDARSGDPAPRVSTRWTWSSPPCARPCPLTAPCPTSSKWAAGRAPSRPGWSRSYPASRCWPSTSRRGSSS